MLVGSAAYNSQNERTDETGSSTRFPHRLLLACNAMLQSLAGSQLEVTHHIKIDGACPRILEAAVLQAARELVGNAVRHAFYCRQTGRVFTHVICCNEVGVQVSVSDDGWGLVDEAFDKGSGFRLLRQLGDLYRGAPAAPFKATTAFSVIIPPVRRVQPPGRRLDVVATRAFTDIASSQ